MGVLAIFVRVLAILCECTYDNINCIPGFSTFRGASEVARETH